MQAAVARRELERERNEEIARRGVRITLADDRILSSQTAEERDALRQRVRALLPEEEAAQAIVRLDAKTKAEELALPFVMQTPEEIAASIDALVPGDPGEASADRLALVQELAAEEAKTLRARADDPAEYVMRLPVVQEAFEAVQADGEGLGAAIGTSLASQETIAIPKHLQRALPRARARAMAEDFQATPVAELPAKFRALEAQAGRHAPRVQFELFEAGLDPRFQLLALRADDPAAGLIVRAIQSDPAELRKNIEPATIRTIETAVRGELAPLRVPLRAQTDVVYPSDRRPAAMNALRDIVAKYSTLTDAAFILYIDRGRTDERAARDAAEEAADLLLGAVDFAGRYHFHKRIGGQAIERDEVDAAIADTLQSAGIREFGPDLAGSQP